MERKPVFDAVRAMLGRGFAANEVEALDAAIDRALGLVPAPAPSGSEGGAVPRVLGEAGARLIKKWEGCHKARGDGTFEAYPDPGSADGRPWTIGWGSTGRDIVRGTVWTRTQCDERFDREIVRYADEVGRALAGAPTTQGQFDALVSFHYNTGAIFRATLTRHHRAGRFVDAAAEFAKWVFNDGRRLKGLAARRAEERRLYRGR